MGRRVPEPDAAEAGGLRSGPRRGPAAARQGAQRAGAGRHRCGFFSLVILFCVPLSCEFVVFRVRERYMCFGGFRVLIVLRGFSEFWSGVRMPALLRNLLGSW